MSDDNDVDNRQFKVTDEHRRRLEEEVVTRQPWAELIRNAGTEEEMDRVVAMLRKAVGEEAFRKMAGSVRFVEQQPAPKQTEESVTKTHFFGPTHIGR